MIDEKLDSLVTNALKSSFENGWIMDGYSDEELAVDMLNCDADIQVYPVDFRVLVESVHRCREKVIGNLLERLVNLTADPNSR